MPKLLSALAVSLTLGATCTAAPRAEEALRLPTATLRAAYDEERAGGAERSETLARALLHLARSEDGTRRDALLEQASRLDPALPEAHWMRARLAAQKGDLPGGAAALLQGWSAASADAIDRARCERGAFHASHLLLAATLATLAAALVLRALPLACHALARWLGSRAAALLVLAATLAAAFRPAPILALPLAAILLAPFLRRKERLSLGLLCAALAGLDLALPHFGGDAVLLDPASHSALLSRACDSRPDPALVAELSAPSRRTPEVELVLGLLARRGGDLAGAREHYVASLRADSTSAAAYVDLANLFFRSGQYERAAAGYRAAQSLEPAAALPHANLAQTYIRLMHYDEADRELRAAAGRGFEPTSRLHDAWRDERVPVLDMTPSTGELLALARREARADPARTCRLLQAWRSRPWRGTRPEATGWVLLGIGLGLAFAGNFRKLVVACSGCGAPRCAHCAAIEGPENQCSACRPARARRESRGDPQEARPLRRLRLPRRAWARGIAVLFPGAADAVRGAPFAAALSALVAWSALLAARAAIESAGARSAPWYAAVDAGTLRAAACCFGLAYLPGLVLLRHEERRARAPRRARPAGA